MWELEQLPHTIVTLTEGQVLEEFMLEEETDSQGMEKCKIVELPDKQEIERCTSTEISMKIACDQEECIEEEMCDRSLPKLPKMYRAEESVHKDEIKLVEISELPGEVKLQMPIEQMESKAQQNVSLVSDVPTHFHVVASRKILSKMPRLHIRQREVLGSKIIRRAKPTRLVRRKIPSIYRPPPKPPDRQNRLNIKISKRMLSKTYLSEKRVGYRPIPMCPFMLNANREGKRNSEKENGASYRPTLKPPYILNVNGEVIKIIKNMVPKSKPPQKPPPKSL